MVLTLLVISFSGVHYGLGTFTGVNTDSLIVLVHFAMFGGCVWYGMTFLSHDHSQPDLTARMTLGIPCLLQPEIREVRQLARVELRSCAMTSWLEHIFGSQSSTIHI